MQKWPIGYKASWSNSKIDVFLLFKSKSQRDDIFIALFSCIKASPIGVTYL
jgi:hypothetical protein